MNLNPGFMTSIMHAAKRNQELSQQQKNKSKETPEQHSSKSWQCERSASYASLQREREVEREREEVNVKIGYVASAILIAIFGLALWFAIIPAAKNVFELGTQSTVEAQETKTETENSGSIYDTND